MGPKVSNDTLLHLHLTPIAVHYRHAIERQAFHQGRPIVYGRGANCEGPTTGTSTQTLGVSPIRGLEVGVPFVRRRTGGVIGSPALFEVGLVLP